ncbi:MAG: NUDIX hydrolase [Actinomycetes bacterium]
MSADRKAERVVQAAGGIVWRRRSDDVDEVDVLLVHRPKYDDWTFPKGKLEPGEKHETAALREVEEETGFVCSLGAELETSEYVDIKGRPKLVRYWMMQVTDGAFVVNDEVDDVRWLAVSQAAGLVTYVRDISVLDSFSRALRKRNQD